MPGFIKVNFEFGVVLYDSLTLELSGDEFTEFKSTTIWDVLTRWDNLTRWREILYFTKNARIFRIILGHHNCAFLKINYVGACKLHYLTRIVGTFDDVY